MRNKDNIDNIDIKNTRQQKTDECLNIYLI